MTNHNDDPYFADDIVLLPLTISQTEDFKNMARLEVTIGYITSMENTRVKIIIGACQDSLLCVQCLIDG